MNQFGSQVPFTIDRRTGNDSHAIPDERPFLLGVKIQEYRNGKLLSTVYRDWQVEVVEWWILYQIIEIVLRFV